MTSDQFCFWLQGFFELSDPTDLGEHEVKLIKQHLDLVFEHHPAKKTLAHEPVDMTPAPIHRGGGSEMTGFPVMDGRTILLC